MRVNQPTKFITDYSIGETVIFSRTLKPAARLFFAFAAFLLAAPVIANAACPAVVTSPLNVRLCNAQGNDIADDRPAIQDAVDTLAAAGGGTVYFPPGYYRVGNTIHVPSNIRIQGMGATEYNAQIKLMVKYVPLFEVNDGASNVVFKDLYLLAFESLRWRRSAPWETALIRTEGTTGISLQASNARGGDISDVRIENVRTSQFTYGIAATAPSPGGFVNITNVKIRNYASDGNEYALYANTKGADNWDVQNMNAYPTFDKQNGIFLERSGQMRFLQLSCAGDAGGFCAKLWDNGDTYFRQYHSEGTGGVCIGSDCAATNPTYAGANSSAVTFENSPVGGEVHRATDLTLINNRYWLDFPSSQPVSFQFPGSGANSSVKSCGNVWVSWDPATHRTNTTVIKPSWDYPGLPSANLSGCERNKLTAAPVFSTGYEPDNERLTGEVSVLTHGATNGGTNDDAPAFRAALAAARTAGSRRVFVPAGTYDIESTVNLVDGETILGEAGSVVNLKTSGTSLFRIENRIASPGWVKGVTFRNLALTSVSNTATIGINFENFSEDTTGAASDYQIQNVDFNNFENGIAVRPMDEISSSPAPNKDPMFDSVSVKDGDFTNNKIPILMRSDNASNWNLENLRVTIPGSDEGVRIDGGGNVSVRNISCTGSGSGSSCLNIKRHTGAAVESLTATGVLNALVAPWESGWSQFPVTFRNSNFRAGVYFQGKIYLSSINNVYPARLTRNSTARQVIFGTQYDGSPFNDVSYGELSKVYSCDDEFRDPAAMFPATSWSNVVGTLSTPVTMCY